MVLNFSIRNGKRWFHHCMNVDIILIGCYSFLVRFILRMAPGGWFEELNCHVSLISLGKSTALYWRWLSLLYLMEIKELNSFIYIKISTTLTKIKCHKNVFNYEGIKILSLEQEKWGEEKIRGHHTVLRIPVIGLFGRRMSRSRTISQRSRRTPWAGEPSVPIFSVP